MKLQEKEKNLVIVGEDFSKKATISVDKMRKLQYLLTKGLYKDPITAVIAEWTNNGVDSIMQSGKNPTDNPVIVSITTNDRYQYVFSVEDNGVGLDDIDFEEICMNYLESTKEEDNESIGCYGLGMKSFLSLERSATFRCRKNGIERIYLAYEGEEFLNYELIGEKETIEENGVKAEIIIKDYTERQMFINKAKQKLAYYDSVILKIDDSIHEWDIWRNNLFQISSSNNNSTVHLCLKDVYYTIDWDALGIPPVNAPIALRFNLDSGIIPTPSRESYITNETTKSLIIKRLSQVSDWIIEKYNEKVGEFITFRDAYSHVGNLNPCLDIKLSDIKSMKLPLKNFARFTNIKIAEPKIDGMVLHNPSFYKENSEELFYEYNVIGFIANGKVYPKGKIYMQPFCYHSLLQNKKVVIVDELSKGYKKNYLLEKYIDDTLLVSINKEKRSLKKSDSNSASYISLLGLGSVSKGRWREYIKEWCFVRDQVTSVFIDERNFENTDEYKTWLSIKKEEKKNNRKSYSTKLYTNINKKEGDVTLGYIEVKREGGWKKKAFSIEDLKKNHYLTVLIDENNKEEKELAKKLYRSAFTEKNLNFATVGKRERLKIPKTYQFINFSNFMSKDCKPFMRLASSLLFQEFLIKIDPIIRFKDGIIKNCLKNLNNDLETLKEYINRNIKNCLDESTKKYIIDVAETHSIFDYELWDVYERAKKGVDKYSFISCLKEPHYWDEEEKRIYNRTINQFLLFRKLYYKDLPNEISDTINH